MNAVAPITQRVITRPQYAQAESFDTWLRLNHMLVWNYWCELERAIDADPERPSADMFDFAQCQYEIDCADVDGDSASESTCNAWQDSESEAAGVPIYGEL